MPVRKCSNGKYRIGDGDCIYKTKSSAEKAYAGYRASKYAESAEASMRRSLDILEAIENNNSDILLRLWSNK